MLGASVRRVEDHRLLVGGGRFVDDIRLPQALHVVFVRSDQAHARLRSIDVANARNCPGVEAVLTSEDLPAGRDAIAFGEWLLPNARVRAAADPVVRTGALPLLARDRVRYVGQPIAVLAVTDAAAAEDAAQRVQIAYEPLPALTDPEAALAPDAVRLHADWPDNLAASLKITVGATERAFRDAPIVVGGHFRVQRCAPTPIEPRAAEAVYDAWSNELTLYATTQMPFAVRDALAEILNMPSPAVRVQAPDVGGGFGMKSMLYPEDMLVAVLARRLGRPVRWTETRTEQFLSAAHARDQVHDLEIAATRDGQILAVRDRFLTDFGAYSLTGLIVPYNSAAHLVSPFRVPHISIEGRAVVTNKVPAGPYRGAGRPEASFAMNRAVSLLAHKLAMDPLDVCRRNLVSTDEMPHTTGLVYRDGVPLVLDGGDYPAMLETAAREIQNAEIRAEQSARRGAGADHANVKPRQAPDSGVATPRVDSAQASVGNGKLLGVGLACFVEGTGVGPPEGATVEVASDGTVFVKVSAASQGQGHATTLAQVCASELGVPFTCIRVVGGDTLAPTFGVGTMASRTAVLLGNSVAEASQEVARRARRIAAALLECAEEDLELAEGVARVAGSPARAIPLGALAGAAVPASPFAALLPDPGLIATRYFKPETVTFTSAVHAAVVDVDPETGHVDILRYVAVEDCGRMINPMLVDGQVRGGIAQGIATALQEELVYSTDGQLLTASFLDYASPTARSIPTVKIVHYSTASPRNALGIRGIGEAGAIGGQAAVANAVADALQPLGARVVSTPLTPQVIYLLTHQQPSPHSEGGPHQ
jgi:carbon-monoxide dehydrogenase large subunit